jgi:hypothetical protein
VIGSSGLTPNRKLCMTCPTNLPFGQCGVLDGAD